LIEIGWWVSPGLVLLNWETAPSNTTGGIWLDGEVWTSYCSLIVLLCNSILLCWCEQAHGRVKQGSINLEGTNTGGKFLATSVKGARVKSKVVLEGGGDKGQIQDNPKPQCNVAEHGVHKKQHTWGDNGN
jgi:hypothetical protein